MVRKRKARRTADILSDPPLSGSQTTSHFDSQASMLLPTDADVVADAKVLSPPALFNDELSEKARIVAERLGDNNATPSNADLRVLDSAVEHLDSMITLCKINIALHRGEVNSVIREMQLLEMQKQRNFFAALRSPLRCFPDEILAHVFSFHAGEEVVPLTTPTLVIVIQVCRLWRNACLGCPTLWASLSIVIPRRGLVAIPSKLGAAVKRIPGGWFKHAKDLPLHFSLDATYFDHVPPIMASGLLDSVLPNLVDLRVTVKVIDQLYTFLRLPPGTLPALRSINLRCTQPKGTPIAIYSVLFKSCTHLQKATLEIFPLTEFSFPWSQLSYLDTPSLLALPEWLSIIVQCPRLEVGHFYICVNDKYMPRPNVKPTTFPQMKTLTLDLEGLLPIPLVPGLRFPALRDLTISTDNLTLQVNHFLDSFDGSSLRRLSLARVIVDPVPLNQFLTTCNALEELLIDLPHEDLNIFRTLLSGGTTGPSLPNLTSFTTCVVAQRSGHTRDAAVYTPDLAEVILRWHLQHRLTHATVLVNEKSDVAAFQWHREFTTDAGKALVQDLISSLNGCIYDEVENANGLILDMRSFSDTRRAYSLSKSVLQHMSTWLG
ncbi:hypothetical protein DXG03_000155 [Asterophora parasitica]|uniref:F-box domain-containing protein n=1 Tax=Asterophora parasitica TaxID=117018 RepID=A0A9P7KE64_9AGAR|nr:hypothetical protein DXG03_000155 [Asterophora parasitica]